MRLGIDGLSRLIQQATGRPPCDGAACAFRNRRGNRLKLLVWDGAGIWLCRRRLHTGRFKWPAAGDTIRPLTSEQWQWLSPVWSGGAWRRRHRHTGGYKPGNGPPGMMSDGAMDINIGRTATAQTADASVDGRLEQLAAAERRAGQAEQARQAVGQQVAAAE